MEIVDHKLSYFHKICFNFFLKKNCFGSYFAEMMRLDHIVISFEKGEGVSITSLEHE